MKNNNVCVVCEYGWIIKGVVYEQDNDEVVYLTDASVVRNWRNGKGIGGIAKVDNKNEYNLDAIGDVIINADKVLFTIPCEW